MLTNKQMIRVMMTAQAASEERMRIQNAHQHEELMKCINETTDKVIKSKNRVDISLDEYDAMKEHIKQLSGENHRMKSILEKFEFPYDLPIDPSSIVTSVCEDRCRFKSRYCITFDVEHTGKF